jgi:hypothetical protein
MSTTAKTGKTKFEEDLQVYFPDLYKFWSLFAYDPFYEEVMQGVHKMVDENGYGTLEIVYNNGKINYVNLKQQLTAHKSHKIEKMSKRD